MLGATGEALVEDTLIARENLKLERIKARAQVTTAWAKEMKGEDRTFLEALDIAEERYDAQNRENHSAA